MKKKFVILFLVLSIFTSEKLISQINENTLGSWYMYFWNTKIKESQFGFQGDIQYRNWNIIGDLEQLLLRGGVTYVIPDTKAKFILGYAYVTTGNYGNSDATSNESRIYQEALFPQKIANHIFLTHRFRYEQRFVENQDFRTRYRYNLFLNIPLNKERFIKGTIYLAFYNEIFLNGQRNIGNGNTVEIFDRNRTYGALGYNISDNLKLQVGFMQQTTDNWSKGQFQLSIHHKFNK